MITQVAPSPSLPQRKQFQLNCTPDKFDCGVPPQSFLRNDRFSLSPMQYFIDAQANDCDLKP